MPHSRIPYPYGQILLSLIPVRAEPGHRSEMVTQILFGETVEILDVHDEWVYVAIRQDGYRGWVEQMQVTPVDEHYYHRLSFSHFADEDFLIHTGRLPVVVRTGSPLPYYNDGTVVVAGNIKIPYRGNFRTGKHSADEIIETALRFLNTPYLWGGKSELGLDCSGLTQLVYRMNGYPLPRDASQQVQKGQSVETVQKIQKGDLAFFGGESGAVSHVGIIMENGKIIHAAKGKVRIDKLDEKGIFNIEMQEYSHTLRIIKRLI